MDGFLIWLEGGGAYRLPMFALKITNWCTGKGNEQE